MGTSSANGFFLAVPKSLDVSSGSARGTNKLALGIGVRAPAGAPGSRCRSAYPGVHVPDVVTVPAGDRGV